MDLVLFLQVLKRFRYLVGAGFVVAVVLAVFSYGTPRLVHGKPTIAPRGVLTYQSVANVLVTERGFPYGQASSIAASEMSQLSQLAPVYAAFVSGDRVQEAIRAAHIPGTLTAAAQIDQATGQGLPIVTLTSEAPTAKDAVAITQRAEQLLRTYVTRNQEAAGTAPAQRIELDVVDSGSPATLVSGHKISIPLMVFMAVFLGTVALAFALAKMRPTAGHADGGSSPRADHAHTKRSPLPAKPSVVSMTAIVRSSAGSHRGPPEPRDTNP